MLSSRWRWLLIVVALACTQCTPGEHIGIAQSLKGLMGNSRDSLMFAVINYDAEGYIIDTYKDKPFKAGDTITQKINFNIGNIPIRGTAKFVLGSSDGIFYNLTNDYRVEMLSVIINKELTAKLPKEILDGLTGPACEELSAEEILDSEFMSNCRCQWEVDDFNMDGVPDFAFAVDQGFHSNVYHYQVWVNMHGRLQKWANVSGYAVYLEDTAKRILTVHDYGKFGPRHYRVVKDTTLIPIKVKE